MPLVEPIIACASGPGRSARAILRVFGTGAHDLLRAACVSVAAGDAPVTVMRVRVGDASLPCVVIRYAAPRSYTGEDGFELVAPGNRLLVDRIIRSLQTTAASIGLNLRDAQPGEFSARAYLAGKLSLDQAEGIAALVAAQTHEQLAAAAELLDGRTGDRYREWNEELATLLALVEAGIDFTDQDDVVAIRAGDLRTRLSGLREAVAADLGSAGGTERLSDQPRVVLIGRPNAGKSTLFNALLGRRRAVVSEVAGTTRDVLAEHLDLSPGTHDQQILLVDLAGLDESAVGTVEAAAQTRAREELSRADVVVHCDPAGRFGDLGGLPAGIPAIRVRTKADLPAPSDVDPHAVGVCALDGWQLGVLKRTIADAAWGSGAKTGSAASLLPRHHRVLAAVQRNLASVTATLATSPPDSGVVNPEVVAEELRSTLDLLGELVGRISPDDVLGRVFATFCVGK